MPPGKNPHSAVIKLGKHVLTQIADGRTEFSVEDLMAVTGNTDKGSFLVVLRRYMGMFKSEGDQVRLNLDLFKAESDPLAAFGNEIREQLTFLEPRGRGIDRK